MIPLVDTHCHLLAGLDDGPPTRDDALRMCQESLREGIQLSVALAHQNPYFPDVTPPRIHTAAQQLAQDLRESGIGLTVFPCAEIMVHPDLERAWRDGELVSIADRGQYLLLEMPHGQFVDLGEMAVRLRPTGLRPIVAHAERYPELLHDRGLAEQWIEAGCLIQVCSVGVTDPPSRAHERALKRWFQRGLVHVFGSDGHSLDRRPPHMRAAYEHIVLWAGTTTADRICSTNGMAVLQGLPLRVPPPPPVRWLAGFWR